MKSSTWLFVSMAMLAASHAHGQPTESAPAEPQADERYSLSLHGGLGAGATSHTGMLLLAGGFTARRGVRVRAVRWSGAVDLMGESGGVDLAAMIGRAVVGKHVVALVAAGPAMTIATWLRSVPDLEPCFESERCPPGWRYVGDKRLTPGLAVEARVTVFEKSRGFHVGVVGNLNAGQSWVGWNIGGSLGGF